jgi:hypothetical protein
MGTGGSSSAAAAAAENKSSSSAFSFVKGFLPKYFSSEWSLAQFKLPECTRSLVAFGPEPHTLVVVSVEGTYYKVGGRGARTGEPLEGLKATNPRRSTVPTQPSLLVEETNFLFKGVFSLFIFSKSGHF